MTSITRDGGYNRGYAACPCFWGREPGTYVKKLHSYLGDVWGLRVLDAGCGEGKNAYYFARYGAYVRAIDISELAIGNARKAWPASESIIWEIGDIRTATLDKVRYDIVIAYGLLHCLSNAEDVSVTIERLKSATQFGGYHVVCCFNSRGQDLRAHPELSPCLLSHDAIIALYSDWQVLEASDEDLFEIHPHNNIPHFHSLTRLLAQNS